MHLCHGIKPLVEKYKEKRYYSMHSNCNIKIVKDILEKVDVNIAVYRKDSKT